jgi:membrane-associated protease RseP (regulator of RpoE activity)
MTRWFKILLAAGLAASLGICQTSQAQNRDRQREDSRSSPHENNASDAGFLGLAVEAVPPALMSHLSKTIGEDRGVLVAAVAPDSPAERAGLRPHDVIVSYDDQRLFSPEQFVGLVRHDKPGREARLDVVRNGAMEHVKAKLGSREQAGEARRYHAFRPATSDSQSESANSQDRASGLELFDALALTRIDHQRFRAEISYRDDSGKIVRHKFEGTPEELRKDISGEKDLPREEREQLLGVLQSPLSPAAPFSSETGQPKLNTD